MERNIIQWNVVNWGTVLLMVIIGNAVIAAGTAFYQQKFGKGS